MEKYLNTLSGKINSTDIHNAYRRELSNVNDEKQLSELLSEIAVCATISKISNKIFLKPETKKPKHCDFKVELDEYVFYGEVKRFEDKTKIIGRSIKSDTNYKSKQKTTRPRFLELESKLQDVYKQLPDDTVNVLFVFHSSIGETIRYVKQVLFGESNFWSNNLALEPNSLFSKPEWENISTVCLCRLGNNEFVEFYEIFINPNAKNMLPNIVLEKIIKCA